VLNAANEIAVGAFLDHKLGFMAIPRVIQKAMQAHDSQPVSTLQAVRHADAWARRYARDAAHELELTV
jgi:1-deoxy-D-xylulose-5-phosphate reductoisomerase